MLNTITDVFNDVSSYKEQLIALMYLVGISVFTFSNDHSVL